MNKEDANNQLLLAATSGDLNGIDQAIKNGGNVNAVDARNTSALHYALYNNKLEALKKLVELGADLTLKDTFNYNGYTPLHWCAAAGKIESLKILLSNPFGQHIHIPNGHGQKPVELASSPEIKQLLEESMKEMEKIQMEPTQPTSYVYPIQVEPQNIQHVESPQEQTLPTTIPQGMGCRRRCKKFKPFLIAFLILCPILNFLFSPYGYPWFIIPWAITLTLFKLKKIKKNDNLTTSMRKFKVHKVFFLAFNGFMIISNLWAGGFPWSLYPLLLWGIIFGIHAIKTRFTKYNTAFHIHALVYVCIAALIFITFCFGTCRRVNHAVPCQRSGAEPTGFAIHHLSQPTTQTFGHQRRGHWGSRPKRDRPTGFAVHHLSETINTQKNGNQRRRRWLNGKRRWGSRHEMRMQQEHKPQPQEPKPHPPKQNPPHPPKEPKPHPPHHQPVPFNQGRVECHRSFGLFLLFFIPLFVWGLGLLYHFRRVRGHTGLNFCNVSIQWNPQTQQQTQPQEQSQPSQPMSQQPMSQQPMSQQPMPQMTTNVHAPLIRNEQQSVLPLYIPQDVQTM